MKVTSGQVYTTLKGILSSPLTTAGFRRAKGVSLGWTKPEGDGSAFVSFQCDKYGWSDDWGSTFTCEIELSRTSQPRAANFGGRFRLSHLLTGEELETLRERNNRIIEALPGYLAGKTVAVTDGQGMECVIVGFRPAAEPYHSGWDTWMHYASEAHVAEWGAYLETVLPILFARAKARAS